MFNEDLIGQRGRATELSGPALILDRKTFARNLATMAERCAAAGVNLRPHGKTHKSGRIAMAQMAAGACGICCATAHEVAILASMGIGNILLTSPLAEPRKIAALAALARVVTLSVVVDDDRQVDMWEAALIEADASVSVLIDIDVGMGRTGARGEQVVELASRVRASRVLGYAGVQAYSGMVQHIASYDERKAAYLVQMDQLSRETTALRESGLPPKIVSGGGTGTADIDLTLKLFTELQAGSYVFMDVEYQAVQLTEQPENPFAPALFVRSNVISANVAGHVTVNAGFKSLSTDGPVPVLRDAHLNWRYDFFGDEYGRISGAGVELLQPGDAVDIVVPHCDPTANLHDCYHVIEEDTLVDIWRIDARGSL